MRVRLASPARETMERAWRAARPHEACGLLFGEAAGGDVWVRSASVAANVAATPAQAFEVDPRHLLEVQRAARAGGPAAVGVWHSHPSGPLAPSAADRAGVTDPTWVWIIVGPGGLAAWLPDREAALGFRPLPVEPPLL
ncbi:MAG: Mov34/MPN/PAD-1 family protein [Thermaurantiacus tibetensis]|uniref:Mov34/MPN/PAD-1 family protein n=1 Tax=Thermaurantiacus tibetensis TaxID=2759035 RepID=UPI001F21262E|nr:Mov34/MPN/PAD-1 family protein [Thermaurantiacus tibetensis]